MSDTRHPTRRPNTTRSDTPRPSSNTGIRQEAECVANAVPPENSLEASLPEADGSDLCTDIRPSDKIYQQESPAENRSAERNHTRQRGAPGKQTRRYRQDKCGSQTEPRSKNRHTAQERSVRRGSLRQPATDNRNPIVADRYPIGLAPPFHASSSKFSLSMADRSPRTSRGQTKKPTRFASARRTAYRNRTSICRLRIYRPNR